jgi:hypothetical protein
MSGEIERKIASSHCGDLDLAEPTLSERASDWYSL